MKILMVIPISPVPTYFGAAIRVKYLLRKLASEHDVTVVTFGTPDQRELFMLEFGDLVDDLYLLPQPWSRKYKRMAQICSIFSSRSYFFMSGYSRQMQKKIIELMSTRDFDVVHTEFPFMSQYHFPGDAIRVLDAHNVEYENFRRMALKHRSLLRKWFYHMEYRKVYREEVAMFRKQDILMATSKEDIAIIKRDVDDVPAYVIPNGVDTSFFSPHDWQPEQYSLVFTGMMGYTPNDDGMLWFLDEIFPLVLKELPNTKINIVGNQPSDELRRHQSENVIVTGFVDDVRPYVWNSSVFVVPLRMGSGTRLKVVEALAMNKPVVSTSIGCEGIEVEHGNTILIHDDPSEFAGAVVDLLKNRELCLRLVEKGYKLVTSVYDWTVIGDRMLEVYEVLDSPTVREKEVKGSK